jgi:MFS family permease
MPVPTPSQQTPDRQATTPPVAVRTWSAGTLTYTLAGLVLLGVWLLMGDFAYYLRERSAAPVTQLMLKKFGASDFVTGIFLLTIPWTVILLVGPAVSYWSDRYRSRWGRRIPFLLVPIPFVTLSMIGLAFSPAIGTALNAWLGGDPDAPNHAILLVMGVCWAVFEIGVVVSNSVFGALINDVVPRDLLGRFYGMFRAVGLGVGVLFNYKIIGHAETNYTVILAGIGLIYGVSFTIMCLRVKEGTYPPPPPSDNAPRARAVRQAAVGYFRDCFARPYYLGTFLFLGLANLAFVPVNTFSIYAAKSYGLSMERYGQYLVASYLCSFVLAFPLGWLADRFHPLRVGLATLAVYVVLMCIGFFWMRDARSFGWAFLAHVVLSGSFFTGCAAITQLLFPQQKFAQFAAASNLVAALFNIALGPVLGGVLDKLGNDYRYTFLAGGLIALLAIALGGLVHRRWQQLGGKNNYVAPE